MFDKVLINNKKKDKTYIYLRLGNQVEMRFKTKGFVNLNIGIEYKRCQHVVFVKDISLRMTVKLYLKQMY